MGAKIQIKNGLTKNKKRIIFFVLCSLNRIFAIKKMAKILSLDKKRINSFVLCSLNRIFAS